jgi:hypothetical protein
MKHIRQILPVSILFLSSCITQFVPETNEAKEFLIVEGLITNSQETNFVKLSKSLPLGVRSTANPVSRCAVSITDDRGSRISFHETTPGTYVPLSSFQGVVGRFYTLHVAAYLESGFYNYESYPMEMKPVPPIDSIYSEKVTINMMDNNFTPPEGCQVYLNTHDESGRCKFYRWEYDETWKIAIPYSVRNRICYVSAVSDVIKIKSTSILSDDKITKFPLAFISNSSDRLSSKYSMLVHQYSLNEDEYLYWEKLQNISENVGGLYDMIPSAIPSNVYCIENPDERVLGYFSVSATTSKRIFIKDYFKGLFNMYTADRCVSDTIRRDGSIPGINESVWVLVENFTPPYRVITYTKGCADCTVRGTTTAPDFWIQDY